MTRITLDADQHVKFAAGLIGDVIGHLRAASASYADPESDREVADIVHRLEMERVRITAFYRHAPASEREEGGKG